MTNSPTTKVVIVGGGSAGVDGSGDACQDTRSTGVHRVG